MLLEQIQKLLDLVSSQLEVLQVDGCLFSLRSESRPWSSILKTKANCLQGEKSNLDFELCLIKISGHEIS